MQSLNQKKVKVARLSVISNTLLVIAKLFVGLISGSVSVISEAIHSGVDLVAAVIAYIAVKAANKPADPKHPFGHGKYENVSGTVEALLIFAAAFWIIYESIEKLLHPEPLSLPFLGIIIMGISAVVNWMVSNQLFKIGKESDSIALQADAWHLRTDVYTSAGVAFGLLCYWIAQPLFPKTNLQWIDPVFALLVALLIIKAAWDLTLESIKGLLDTSLTHEELEVITQCINQHEHVQSFHDLKTRKSGADKFIEFHIVVDPDMTVAKAHKVSEDIITEIEKLITKATVLIHHDHEDDSIK